MIKGMIYKCTDINTSNCDSCAKSKTNFSPYPRNSVNKSKHVGHLVYSDVCGPITPNTKGGKKYFVVFLDDYSRFVSVYLMEQKTKYLKN